MLSYLTNWKTWVKWKKICFSWKLQRLEIEIYAIFSSVYIIMSISRNIIILLLGIIPNNKCRKKVITNPILDFSLKLFELERILLQFFLCVCRSLATFEKLSFEVCSQLCCISKSFKCYFIALVSPSHK